MKWKVGQKVLCIKSHSSYDIVKGQVFIVKRVLPPYCNCIQWAIDIGMEREDNFMSCLTCKTKLHYPNDNVNWFSEKLFIPIENSVQGVVTEFKKIKCECECKFKTAQSLLNENTLNESINYKYLYYIPNTVNPNPNLNDSVIKYKYLSYIGPPKKLDPNFYDLVDDEEFCKSDGRIPLLLVTQHGIFPGNYLKLEGLENQECIGFLVRGYLSQREHNGVLRLFINSGMINRIRNYEISIHSSVWKVVNYRTFE